MVKQEQLNSGEDFIRKFGLLLKSPNEFFEEIKNEEGISISFLTYLFISLLIELISFGMMMTLGRYVGSYSMTMGFSAWRYFSLIFLVFSLAIPFIYASISHVILLMFSRGVIWKDTFNVITYSLIPYKIFGLVPFFGGLTIIYSIILSIIGLAKLHNISKGKATAVILFPLVVVIGIMFILAIFLLTRMF